MNTRHKYNALQMLLASYKLGDIDGVIANLDILMGGDGNGFIPIAELLADKEAERAHAKRTHPTNPRPK